MTRNSVRKVVCAGAHSQLVAFAIPPGGRIEKEVHNNSDQAIFVLEGMLQAILDGQAETTREHDAIFIPAGTVHTLENSGKKELRMFVLYSPPITAEGSQTAVSGKMNFDAIAQSAPRADERDASIRQVFPAAIKWTGRKAPTLRRVLFALISLRLQQ